MNVMQLSSPPDSVKTRRRRRPEQQLQRTLIAHLRWRAPRDTWWAHYPGGGARSAVEGAIFRGLGVRAGTPDLLLLKSGKLYCIELKSDRGRLSAAQIACHEELRAAGATVETVSNIDEALELLALWGIL
jgi:hypothetical protein